MIQNESMVGHQPGEERYDRALDSSFRWCPPGKFLMGSPSYESGRINDMNNEEQVFVTISRGFWMAQYPVTQQQVQRILGTSPSQFTGPMRPAETVSWDDANDFCEKLTSSAREIGELSTDWEYRLPTEAQWEYACRAGWSTAYNFGNDEDQLGEYSWSADNSDFETQQVGQKKPNAWGLYDMHGNVWEWCQDWYHEELVGGVDPEVTTPATHRVIRGGCWLVVSSICRSASRSRSAQQSRFDFVGFRVALVQCD